MHIMHVFYAPIYAPNMGMWGIPEKSSKNAAQKHSPQVRRHSNKTLPEAQRTQDIEFIIQITFMTEINQTNKQTNKRTNKQDVLVYLIFIFAIFLKI